MENLHMVTNPEQPDVPTQPQPRGRGTAPFIIGALVALALAAAGVWWVTNRTAPPVAPPAPVVETPKPAVEAPKTASLEGSDATIREWASKAGLPSIFSPFFEGGDLARRIVSTLWTISEGESPARLLAFLKPSGEFEVFDLTNSLEGRGAFIGTHRRDPEAAKGQRVRMAITPKSYARYDGVAAGIGLIDAKVAAQAWTALEPVFEMAHQEIAPPGRTVRQTLDGALGRLLTVPVPEGEVEVVPAKGALYAFRDPKLESLTPAQKHLLRMGAANIKTIQAKLREFQTALGPATK